MSDNPFQNWYQKPIQPEIGQLFSKERVCALTILLPNGTPHSAAMHFSFTDTPLTLYFSTDKTSRKCTALRDVKHSRSSVVIGFSESDWKTIQLDGNINLVEDSDEIDKIKDVHYQRHPNSQKFEGDPNTVFLSFVPAWFRYTDFSVKPPKIIETN